MAAEIPDTAEQLTVSHSLRRRWKPIKLKLAELDKQHPSNVRFHRACSWLQRLEPEGTARDLDMDLISLWIVFNALYGQWDSSRAEPVPDRECWRSFLDRILKLDRKKRLETVLLEHKKLVLAILDDSYLAGFFWRSPSREKAFQTNRDKRSASMWYVEKKWPLILQALVERIYLMRCQLVHGAATHGGKPNRGSLKRCVAMLNHLVPAILEVWIDDGGQEDWGPMCYPPVG